MTQVQVAHQLAVSPRMYRAPRLAVSAPRGLQGMRLTRRGRIVVWTLGLILAIVVTLLGARAGADGSPQAIEVGRHAVASGETVWSLAVGLNSGQDVRDVVAEILTLNGRTSPSLYAGEIILLPRY